jgi:hypothetical protein
MKKQTLLLAAAFALLGACSKTEDGNLVVKRPVDVNVTTTKDTINTPRVGSKIDTINTPVVGTQKETLIVNKPVVGSKKTEVKVPVITKKP